MTLVLFHNLLEHLLVGFLLEDEISRDVELVEVGCLLDNITEQLEVVRGIRPTSPPVSILRDV